MDNLTIQDKAKPKISVIIPVYNTEKYLEASVRSIMNQTYRNLEIICVNDGSTDGSLDILNRLKAEDDRIIVLSKENGGLGDTRNFGIAHSSCEWLSFLDSDDTLEPHAFETVSKAFESQPDMIHFGIRVVSEDGSEVDSKDVKYYNIRYEGMHNLTDSMILHVDVSAADKLFRKSIINRYNMRFEKIYFEDYQFSMQYMSVIRTVYYFKDKLYNYLRRGGSIMNQTFARTPRAIDHLRAFDYFCAFVHENKMNEEFRRLLSKSFVACYSFSIRYITQEKLQDVVAYATELYRKYGVLNKRLDRVIENRTVKFASTRKNGLMSFYLQKLFALRYEYVDYKLYKVLKIFGIIVYKIPKN